jgi:hypothetical protein
MYDKSYDKSIAQSYGDRNFLHTKKRRKANWIGQISRRKQLLKHIRPIEGKMEGGM